jgi:hypothetical protein
VSGEVAACRADREDKWGEGGEVSGQWLLFSGSVVQREEEKGQGARGSAPRGGGNGGEAARVKSRPGGSGWTREGVRGREAVVASGADRRSQPAQCRPFGFKPVQINSRGFKILQILTDSKGAFPCSKSWK